MSARQGRMGGPNRCLVSVLAALLVLPVLPPAAPGWAQTPASSLEDEEVSVSLADELQKEVPESLLEYRELVPAEATSVLPFSPSPSSSSGGWTNALLAMEGEASPGTVSHALHLVSERHAENVGAEGSLSGSVSDDRSIAHASPSEAVRALASHYEVTITADQEERIGELDELPDSLAAALTDVLDAYLHLDATAREVYAVEGDEAVEDLPDRPPPVDELADVLEARQGLLEATLSLEAEVNRGDPSAIENAEPILLPPALALDLQADDSEYTEDYALLLDGGGDDEYANNAGGSNLNGGECIFSANLVVGTLSGPFGGTGAAALVDLSGDDRYVSGPRVCGVAGGGYGAVGFLYDAAGDDVYGESEHADPWAGSSRATSTSTAGTATSSRPPATDEYILRFHDYPADLEVGDTVHREPVVTTSKALGYAVLDLEGADLASFSERVLEDPNVRYLEPNHHVEWLQTDPTNDPLYPDQYGPEKVNAPEAWEKATGADDRTLCVLDTGIRYTHEDLAEAYLGGHDFVHEDGDPWDDNGHGTHVAGIAVAETNNSKGIAGIAEGGVLAAKVLNSQGAGTYDWVARGIAWCVDQGGDVVNLSLAGPHSQTLQDAVRHAWENGAVVIAAAGNEGCDDCVGYPAAYPRSLAVGCSDQTDRRCSFSNMGLRVELGAPGQEVLSASGAEDDAYMHLSGTSMSTPHAAGVAALAWNAAPDLSNAELRQLLRDTASDIGDEGCDQAFGFGLPNADAAVSAALEGARPALDPVQGCHRASIAINGGGTHNGVGLLIDRGGDDEYAARDSGTNGGGYRSGAGYLLDFGGNDSYLANSEGTNGGATSSGHGTLLDWAGEDTYVGGYNGTNGGASSWSTGFLLDRGFANDSYEAGAYGTNGGGHTEGQGLLVDEGGEDAYAAGRDGVNGGAATFGQGALFDLDGNDEYHAGDHGTNGGGVDDGRGSLLDLDGDDGYHAGDHGTNGGGADGEGALLDLDGNDEYHAGDHGTNGGGGLAGHGLLFDAAGSDRYKAGDNGSNGGGYDEGRGNLVDLAGSDLYDAGKQGTNGGAFTPLLTQGFSRGLLWDAAGTDTYTAEGFGTNGGAHQRADGTLVDRGGDDEYVAGSHGTNGGAEITSTGRLLDASGDDSYDAGAVAVNGGAQVLSNGLLGDGGGHDHYEDDDGGTGEDRTVAPKGEYGAQVDGWEGR